MTTGTLSAKGWVVIPKEMRERYGLKKGDKVRFIDDDGIIAIVPISKDPIRHITGMLKGKDSLVDALLKSRAEDKAKGK